MHSATTLRFFGYSKIWLSTVVGYTRSFPLTRALYTMKIKLWMEDVMTEMSYCHDIHDISAAVRSYSSVVRYGRLVWRDGNRLKVNDCSVCIDLFDICTVTAIHFLAAAHAYSLFHYKAAIVDFDHISRRTTFIDKSLVLPKQIFKITDLITMDIHSGGVCLIRLFTNILTTNANHYGNISCTHHWITWWTPKLVNACGVFR